MCGIAGVIYGCLERSKYLGSDLLTLIQPLESRGPDSCGVALYGNPVAPNQVKLLWGAEANLSRELRQWLANFGQVMQWQAVGTGGYAVLQSHHPISFGELKAELALQFPQIRLLSLGQQLEVYKEVGSAINLFQKYNLQQFSGSHGIGHTRMATESVVDTAHSHPFTTAADLAIVHNGQVSNYYRLRFTLERQGMVFETHNDSEAIAHYIRYQLSQGKSLAVALQHLLEDIDGTYTFLVATADQVGLVRDKFAAKPAVIYESPGLIAIASEYRCLMNLPDFDPAATIREPDAGEVNIWSVTANEPIPERTRTVSKV